MINSAGEDTKEKHSASVTKGCSAFSQVIVLKQ